MNKLVEQTDEDVVRIEKTVEIVIAITRMPITAIKEPAKNLRSITVSENLNGVQLSTSARAKTPNRTTGACALNITYEKTALKSDSGNSTASTTTR